MLDQLLFEEAGCLALDEFKNDSSKEMNKSKSRKPDRSPHKQKLIYQHNPNYSINSMPVNPE